MQLVTSDVRSSIRNMTDYRVNGADGPDHCQRWRKGRRRTCEMMKSLWSEGNHGSVIRDRKTERQPEESSERYWRRETKRRWMVRKQNNMVVATVGFCFHRGHDRSLKSWVGFILTSSPSSSLCRLCRADFLLCCHKYDQRGILQASWSRVRVILSLHSFSIIELLHPTMWWKCTIRFIWTSAHPESKGLILTDLNELATP